MTEEKAKDSGIPEAGASPEAELTALRARVAEAEKQAAAFRDQQLRAVAELDNVRKRADRDVATAHKYGADRVLGDLLPVCDSLELGMQAASAEHATAKTIAEGLGLTHRQLHGFLEKQGVRPVDPVGQAFNPDLHEAVSTVESHEVPPNHVVSVMQKGYRLHERLLRPAMVVVARAPAGKAAPHSADSSQPVS
jgi:molecular chaperone GrpE